MGNNECTVMLKKYISHYYAAAPLELKPTSLGGSLCKRKHEKCDFNRNNIQCTLQKPSNSAFQNVTSPQRTNSALPQQNRAGLKKRNTWSSSSSNSSHTSMPSTCSPSKSTKLPEVVAQSAGGDIRRTHRNRSLSVPPREARVDAPRVYDNPIASIKKLPHKLPGRVSSAPATSHKFPGNQSRFRRCIGCVAKGRELNFSRQTSPAQKDGTVASLEKVSTQLKNPLWNSSTIENHRSTGNHVDAGFAYNMSVTSSKWKENASDKRPPWFPAGKGGSAISHHKQLQRSENRQVINRCPSGLVDHDKRPAPQKLSPLSRLNRIGQMFTNVFMYTTNTIKRKCLEKAQIGKTTVKHYRRCCESLQKAANTDSQDTIPSSQLDRYNSSAVTKQNLTHSKSFLIKPSQMNSTVKVRKKSSIHEFSELNLMNGGLHDCTPQKHTQFDPNSRLHTEVKDSSNILPSLISNSRIPDYCKQQKHSIGDDSPMQQDLLGVAYPVISKVDGRSPTRVEHLFGGCTTNVSVASNSHLHSLEPVTYASLWDHVQEVISRSDLINSSCMSQTQQPSVLSKNKMVVSPAVSQETLLHVTEVSETDGNLETDDSLGSKLNTLALNEDYSDSDTWRASDEIDISKESTWKSSIDKPTSHLASPQQVNKLKNGCNSVVLKEGDCELPKEKIQTSGDKKHMVWTKSKHNHMPF